ncbi:MAG: hypothetical protein JXA19_00520 [Anaerolineales bacterium]|nr:hypothetical protein [Anaerolineales bacterium]
MKIKVLVISIFIVILLLIVPIAALADSSLSPLADDVVVFKNDYLLKSGESISGSLVVLFGSAVVEEDANVFGNLVSINSDIEIAGNIYGDLSVVNGSVDFKETTSVYGDVYIPGSDVTGIEGIKISGEIYEVGMENLDYQAPNNDWNSTAPVSFVRNSINKVMSLMISTFTLTALGVVIIILWESRIKTISTVIEREMLTSGAFGLALFIITPVISILLMITIILIPVSFIFLIALVAFAVFGWTSLGFILGERLEEISKQEWTPALKTGIGIFCLSLLIGILNWIPCIGWIGSVVLTSIGLGAAVLTKLGGKQYPREAALSNEIESQTKNISYSGS